MKETGRLTWVFQSWSCVSARPSRVAGTRQGSRLHPHRRRHRRRDSAPSYCKSQLSLSLCDTDLSCMFQRWCNLLVVLPNCTEWKFRSSKSSTSCEAYIFRTKNDDEIQTRLSERGANDSILQCWQGWTRIEYWYKLYKVNKMERTCCFL